MMNNLLFFLPDEAFPLLLVLLGVAVVAGLARPRLLVGLALFLFLLPVIGELVDVFLNAVPWWLFALVIGGLVMMALRAALSIVIGHDAAGHAIGSLAASVIRAVFRLLFLPFRLVGWLVRRRFSR